MSSAQSTTDNERLTKCSFCSEQFSSPKEMGTHLMTCGNKTDECPRCKKFIRRAIFAYHYENECANPDETNDPIPATTERSNDSTKFPSDSRVRTSGESYRNDRQHGNTTGSDFIADRPTRNSHSQATNIPLRITTSCRYCGYDCERDEKSMHEIHHFWYSQAACLENPERSLKKDQSRRAAVLRQESNSSSRDNPISHNAPIPCEFCTESIQSDKYKEHVYNCAKRRSEQIQKQSDFVYVYNGQRLNVDTVRCPYCHAYYSSEQYTRHEVRRQTYSCLVDYYLRLYRSPNLPVPDYSYDRSYSRVIHISSVGHETHGINHQYGSPYHFP